MESRGVGLLCLFFNAAFVPGMAISRMKDPKTVAAGLLKLIRPECLAVFVESTPMSGNETKTVAHQVNDLITQSV